MSIDFSNFTSGIFIFAIFIIALAVFIYLVIKIWVIVHPSIQSEGVIY